MKVLTTMVVSSTYYHIVLTTCSTYYKAFVRPHLDYDNMIYDEAYNQTFHQHLSLFNTIPVYPYQQLSEDHPEKNLP